MRHKSPAEIMSKDHWAIVENVVTHHEGDERSRTNPGHGYPAHSTEALVYVPYETEAEVIDAISRKSSHQRFTVVKAQAVRVQTTTTITLKGN